MGSWSRKEGCGNVGILTYASPFRCVLSFVLRRNREKLIRQPGGRWNTGIRSGSFLTVGLPGGPPHRAAVTPVQTLPFWVRSLWMCPCAGWFSGGLPQGFHPQEIIFQRRERKVCAVGQTPPCTQHAGSPWKVTLMWGGALGPLYSPRFPPAGRRSLCQKGTANTRAAIEGDDFGANKLPSFVLPEGHP